MNDLDRALLGSKTAFCRAIRKKIRLSFLDDDGVKYYCTESEVIRVLFNSDKIYLLAVYRVLERMNV